MSSWMQWLQMAFLATLQGITEFIPISSSGHLVLARHLFRIESPDLILELVLHAGSLISILVFFRKRLYSLFTSLFESGGEGRLYAFLVILGSIPAGLIGLLFKDQISARFGAPSATSLMLTLTGLILLSSRLRHATGNRALNWRTSLLVGLGQAMAILPGISRSGTTITLGRRLGLNPADAAEFSFLLSVPVLLGTSLLMCKDLGQAQAAGWSLTLLFFGMTISAIVGYYALRILMRVLKSGRFWIFGVYCIIAGISSFAWFRFAA